MFQTEPILFLQSLSSDWLTAFLLSITQLGYSSFYIPVLIFLTFGIDFRRGFLLIQMMLWVGILTDLLKNLIALPRPADIDSAVRLLQEDIPNPTPFSGMGGEGFWDLPDTEAVRIIRSQPDSSYGLPSGHVSGTATLWGGLSMLFRPAALKLVGLLMVVLMPISRMYLGRHFLADVLGGFLLAAVVLAVVRFQFVRPGTEGRLLALRRLRAVADLRSAALFAFLLAAPIALLGLGPGIEADAAGGLFGVNAAFVALAMAGLPDDAATWLSRIGRVVLAFVLYAVTVWLVGRGVEASAIAQRISWVDFPAAALPTFVALWGGVRASLALGLYSGTGSPDRFAG